MKAVYSSLIARSPKREIAESFFNSLTRRVFATEGVDQAIEFVDTDFDEAPTTVPLDNRRDLFWCFNSRAAHREPNRSGRRFSRGALARA